MSHIERTRPRVTGVYGSPARKYCCSNRWKQFVEHNQLVTIEQRLPSIFVNIFELGEMYLLCES